MPIGAPWPTGGFPPMAAWKEPACPACRLPDRRYRVLITSSRPWEWPTIVWGALDEQRARLCDRCILVVVHGHCRSGGDSHGHQWASWHEAHPTPGLAAVVEEKHPAEWMGPCRPACNHPPRTRHCVQAGHHRNQDMVGTRPHLTLVFSVDDSSGTWDCFGRVRAERLPWRAWGAYRTARKDHPGQV